MELDDIIFKNIVSDYRNYINPSKDNFMGRYIYRIGQIMKLEKEDYYKMNSFIMKEYNSIIKKTASVIKDLGLKDNPTSYFSVFSYLLWNGYLSVNGDYIHSSNGNLNSLFFGLDIMSGRGDCKSNSSMLESVFKELGLDAYFQINYSDIKSRTKFDIDTKSENNSYLYNNISEDDYKKMGNHASVLTYDNNNYYVYDPTNILMYRVESLYNASLYNGEGKSSLKPWGLILYDSMNVNQVNELLHSIENQDKSKFISENESKDIICNGIEECKKNKSLILDFHRDINRNIEEINRFNY